MRHHATVLVQGRMATHMTESQRSPYLPQSIASSSGDYWTHRLGHLLRLYARCFYRIHLGIVVTITLGCHCN